MYNGGESSKATFVSLKEMTAMVAREAWQRGGGVITIFSCVSTKVHPILNTKHMIFLFLLYFYFLGIKERRHTKGAKTALRYLYVDHKSSYDHTEEYSKCKFGHGRPHVTGGSPVGSIRTLRMSL